MKTRFTTGQGFLLTVVLLLCAFVGAVAPIHPATSRTDSAVVTVAAHPTDTTNIAVLNSSNVILDNSIAVATWWKSLECVTGDVGLIPDLTETTRPRGVTSDCGPHIESKKDKPP